MSWLGQAKASIMGDERQPNVMFDGFESKRNVRDMVWRRLAINASEPSTFGDALGRILLPHLQFVVTATSGEEFTQAR